MSEAADRTIGLLEIDLAAAGISINISLDLIGIHG